ncbi:MAG: extracellular solute-binding protein [Firmicutes bacterium]|nr:extracellular solute-binding protein [Candidatus Fiminaster equi]
MSKIRKLMPFFPVALFAIAALSGCSNDSKGDKKVLRVLNSEDYIYEAEQNEYWCDECEDYIKRELVKETEVDGETVHYHVLNETHQLEFDEEESIWYCDECEDEVDEADVKEGQDEAGTFNYHNAEVEHEVSMDMDMIDQFAEYWADTHDGEEIRVIYDTFDTNETMFNELKTGKTTYDICIPSDYMIQKLYVNDMLHKFTIRDEIWENISPFIESTYKKIEATNMNDNVTASMKDYSVPYMWGTMGVMYNPSYYVNNKGVTEDQIHELMNDWDSLYGEVLQGSFSIKDSVRDTFAVSLIHTYAEEIANTTDHDELTAIFNRHEDKTFEEVKVDMNKLKANAFGFETDSGKTDMTTQKIGANMCWSGDATWAITEARDNDLELFYTIPTTFKGEEGKSASNLWFDCFCMPKNAKDEANPTEKELAQYELAEEFIKFMCMPENAMQNCDYVGYTPATGGDAMLDYMYYCYDIRGEVGAEFIYDEETGEAIPVEDLVEGEDYIAYDLSYFYNGSLSEEYVEIDAAVLYADPDYVGRELSAQYPLEETLDRCAIMNDMGNEATGKLLDMWESVRTNSLPVWAIVLLCFEVAIGLGLGAYFIAKKVSRKKLKKARKNA